MWDRLATVSALSSHVVIVCNTASFDFTYKAHIAF